MDHRAIGKWEKKLRTVDLLWNSSVQACRSPPYGREDVARAMPGSLGCGMICTAGTSRALNPGLDRRDRGVAP